MKIQINDSGSWRHIAVFDKTVEVAMRKSAARFLAIVNERAKLRILDDKGAVKATCRGPDFDWAEVPK